MLFNTLPREEGRGATPGEEPIPRLGADGWKQALPAAGPRVPPGQTQLPGGSRSAGGGPGARGTDSQAH